MVEEHIGYSKVLVLLCLFALFSEHIDAQNIINVKDESERAIAGAIVTITENNSLVAQQVTDENGQVILYEKAGSYIVWVERLSFKKASFKIQITGERNTVDVTLLKSADELDEVVVAGNRLSVSQKMRESFYAPEVIDFKEFRRTSKTVVEVLSMASGLRVQQQGGMGSSSNIMLNGIDGKDVRVFVDEIPVYLLGRGFELQNLAASLVDRIEIYKGLVPVQFGSDALGGVINIVTRKREQDFLEMGYTYGSWNTHEATLSTSAYPLRNKKIFAGFDLVYRHTDNDYWMDDVDVVVDSTYNTKKGRTKRFHDAYDFGLAKAQIGCKGLGWADHIQLISSFTYTNKEWQHGIMALQPWGRPFSVEHTGGVALNWKKSGSEENRWQIDVTAGYNFEQTYFADTSSHIYFWDGSFVEGHKKGESGLYSQGRTPKTIQHVWYGRENAFFRIGDNCSVNINLFTTKRELTGEDKAGTATYKQDPFNVPQILVNNFLGTSFESGWLAGRLMSNTSFKHYYSKVRGVSFKVNNEFNRINESSSSDIGFGQVFKWTIAPRISLIPGYEYTIRQPDSREIFGDYISISPNPGLKSAQSHNINLKVHFKSTNGKVFTGGGGFFRNSKNRIVLSSFANALAAYTNLLQTVTIGGEWFLQYKPDNKIDLGMNITYQDIRLQDVDDLGMFTDKYIGARVPNIPYLFSNAQASYILDPGKGRSCYFRFLYTLSYVHEYFLSWAINGKKSSKATIPSQMINDISISIHSKKERWGFAIDCKNLTNARLYDNFSVQKPGRSIYGKFNYTFTY